MTHTTDPRDAQDVKDGLELFAEGLVRKFVETVEIHRTDWKLPGPTVKTLVKEVELRVLYYNTSRSPEVHLVLRDGSPYCLSRRGNFNALIDASQYLLAELPDDPDEMVVVRNGIIIAEREGTVA